MARKSYAPAQTYTGTGAISVYSFSFKIEVLTQLLVVIYNVLNEEVLRVRGDSSSIGSVTFDSANGGGDVTLLTPLPTGYVLVLLEANDAPTQPFEFKEKTAVKMKTFEMALDWLAGPIQRLRYLVGRTISLSDGADLTAFNPQLPKAFTAVPTAIPMVNDLATGFTYITKPDFDALAEDAIEQALANVDFGGTLDLPTDGKFGGPGSGINGTAGSVSGVDYEDPIPDAFDKVELILEKLAPPKPTNLSATPLSISGSYAAKLSGTGALTTTVIDSTSPQVLASAPFNDGDAGTLSAEMDAVVVGSRVLTTADDTGTYGQLQITADGDPYVGQAGKAGFWKALNARINATALALGIHVAALKHTLTGNATLSFGVDDPGVSTVTFGTIVGAGTAIYISGVPSLPVGGTLTVPVTIANAVRTFYNQTSVGSVSTTNAIASSQSVASPGSANNGDNIVSSPVLSVVGGKYAEAVQVNANGINSKGTAGTVASVTTGIRVDTLSNESARVLSGTGQFPGSGYGGAFVSTVSLATNKELQMLGGTFRYPPAVNYSGNVPTAGPDYSGLTPDSYASMRWVTFNLGAKTAVTSLQFGLVGGVNLGTAALIPGFAMYVRVDGASPTTGWIDANAAYPGVGNPTANGDPALDVGNSTATSRRVTLGAAAKTGNVFVRIGIPSGSTKQFSSVTLA